jgi:polysaccharide export outer membrane protein
MIRQRGAALSHRECNLQSRGQTISLLPVTANMTTLTGVEKNPIKTNHYAMLLALLLITLGLMSRPLLAADNSANVAAAADPVAADAGDRRLIILGPGDSVKVDVFGQPDMNTTEYVGDDGSLHLPLVGGVQVSGMSPVDAAKRIEITLKERQLLVNPHVTLTVVLSHSQRVSVLGEVRLPSRYAIEPNTSIFDLLSQAGGVTPDAADVIFILRKDAAGQEVRIPVNLKVLADKTTQSDSQLLQSGDSVYIPKASQFYIYGEVKAPGKYKIDSGLTVIQAIALAGGVTDRGSARRVVLERMGSNGKTHTMGAHADDPVQPSDVIRVKESLF